VPETALVVEVPEAEPLVAHWRAKYDWSAQRGVAAHITVLYPFMPTELVDETVLRELHDLFAASPEFAFELTQVSRFPDAAWLAPVPATPFSELTELVVSRYPGYPPYEGIHDEVVPHLTVAEGDAEIQGQVETALEGSLPIAAEATKVTLLFEDDAGRWSPRERFALNSTVRQMTCFTTR
jgi:2'-5' RNA ligase